MIICVGVVSLMPGDACLTTSAFLLDDERNHVTTAAAAATSTTVTSTTTTSTAGAAAITSSTTPTTSNAGTAAPTSNNAAKATSTAVTTLQELDDLLDSFCSGGGRGSSVHCIAAAQCLAQQLAPSSSDDFAVLAAPQHCAGGCTTGASSSGAAERAHAGCLVADSKPGNTRQWIPLSRADQCPKQSKTAACLLRSYSQVGAQELPPRLLMSTHCMCTTQQLHASFLDNFDAATPSDLFQLTPLLQMYVAAAGTPARACCSDHVIPNSDPKHSLHQHLALLRATAWDATTVAHCIDSLLPVRQPQDGRARLVVAVHTL